MSDGKQTLAAKVKQWKQIGVYSSDEAWRVVFRREGWSADRFVVVKLFINNDAYSVKFWRGSLQKTAAHWNTKKTESYPTSVIARSLSSLLEVVDLLN